MLAATASASVAAGWARPNRLASAAGATIPLCHGGNLDNQELTAGSTLFLPAFNPGAGFSVGDGHAVQDDGEVCVTAFEAALSGTFELVIRKRAALATPRAETPTHVITKGIDSSLDGAAKQALR